MCGVYISGCVSEWWMTRRMCWIPEVLNNLIQPAPSIWACPGYLICQGKAMVIPFLYYKPGCGPRSVLYNSPNTYQLLQKTPYFYVGVHVVSPICVGLIWEGSCLETVLCSGKPYRETKTGPPSSLIIVSVQAGPICMSRAVTNATIGLGRRISLTSFPVNVTFITTGPVLPCRRRLDWSWVRINWKDKSELIRWNQGLGTGRVPNLQRSEVVEIHIQIIFISVGNGRNKRVMIPLFFIYQSKWWHIFVYGSFWMDVVQAAFSDVLLPSGDESCLDKYVKPNTGSSLCVPISARELCYLLSLIRFHLYLQYYSISMIISMWCIT